MSASGKISFDWGDGHYEFCLPIKQLIELEELCKAGPNEIFERLHAGTWRVLDLREVIRLGLIGGGTEPAKAVGLVRAYMEDRPLDESVKPAQAILMAALVGVPGKNPGKSGNGAADQKKPKSGPPKTSTARARPSASARSK